MALIESCSHFRVYFKLKKILRMRITIALFISSSVNFLVYGNSLLLHHEARYAYKDIFSIIDLSFLVTAINRGIPASSIIEQRALLKGDLGYLSGKAKITCALFLCGIVGVLLDHVPIVSGYS